MGKNSSRHAIKSIRTFENAKLMALAGIIMVLLFVIVAQVKLPQNFGSRAQTVTITNCDITPAESTIDTEEQKLLDLINDYRQRMGAGRLKLSPNLTRAATWLASDMNKSGRLDHTDSTGRAFELRVVQCGYDGTSSAENISNRSVTAEQVLEGWAGSPPHNTNLLNTRYTVAGIARAGSWWALDLGSTDDSNAPPLPSVSQPSTTVPSTAVPSPSTGVPNPGCLGSCVTSAPSQPVLTQQPSTITMTPAPNDPINPDEPIDDSLNPDDGSITPGVPPMNNPEGGNQNGGLIGFLLEFIRLILEFFLSILGNR